jgi:hypothetical protein
MARDQKFMGGFFLMQNFVQNPDPNPGGIRLRHRCLYQQHLATLQLAVWSEFFFPETENRPHLNINNVTAVF